MTASCGPLGTDDRELPVSAELLAVVTSFSQQCSVVLDELSRASSQQPQETATVTAGTSGLPSAVAKSALQTLAGLDERLAQLAHKAIEHDENAHRIQQLEDTLVQYEHAWREQVMELEVQRVKLAALISAGKAERDSIETSKKAQLKPSTILSYARLLAPYTSAPPRSLFPGGSAPDTLAGLPPGSILPYPTEEIMRRGRLAFAEMTDIGESAPQMGAKPRSPFAGGTSKFTGPAGPGQQAAVGIPGIVQRRPLSALAKNAEEVDDFAFDLDLNPDL